MLAGDALGLMVTVESLLLAAVALSVQLGQPRDDVSVKMIRSPKWLVDRVVILICVDALGAVLAWCRIYVGGGLRDVDEIVLALVILASIVAIPVVSYVLSTGLNFERPK